MFGNFDKAERETGAARNWPCKSSDLAVAGNWLPVATWVVGPSFQVLPVVDFFCPKRVSQGLGCAPAKNKMKMGRAALERGIVDILHVANVST